MTEDDRAHHSSPTLLTWPARRGGCDLLISIVPPRLKGGRGFRPVDVLPCAATRAPTGPLAGLAAALARAEEVGGTVAIQGFAASRAGRPPLTFVLAVSLANLPYPEATDLPEANVASFGLGCGPGIRVQRLARTGLVSGQAALNQFTATYLAQTEHGVLALALATPHVDGAPEFAVLFDSIARTCAVQSAAATCISSKPPGSTR